MGLIIKNDAAFLLLLTVAVSSATQKYAELERHIEARKGRIAVGISARNVMNAVSALLDYLENFCEPVFSAVIRFLGTSHAKASANDRENYGVKNWGKVGIEGAVHEDVAIASPAHLPLLGFWENWPDAVSRNTLEIDVRISLVVKLLGPFVGVRIMTPSFRRPETR